MRWIVIALLLLNIMVFAWFWRQGGDPVPQNTPDVEVEYASLMLLSEREIVVAPACYEVGPFADQADASLVLVSLGASFTTQLLSRQTQTRTDYRVFLPPYSSRDEASAALQELRQRLQAANLAIDSFLMTRGEYENGIAVGLFAERDNALNVQRQLDTLGYRVVLEEEPGLEDAIWMIVTEAPEGPSLLSLWPLIQQQRPLLQRIEKLC